MQEITHEINIYLDIETIPGQGGVVLGELKGEAEKAKATIKPPSNYKDEAKIAEYMASKQTQIDADSDARWRKTSFDGAYGQIAEITVAINELAPVNIFSEDWANDERVIISDFYKLISSVCKPSDRKPKFIGHNILAFDLVFLKQRSIVLGIKPPAIIPFDAKHWDASVFDTMLHWNKDRAHMVSLDKLCGVLGVPKKGIEIGEDIDGSMVWDFVRDGRIAEVALYCGGDVERVRAIHRHMTYASWI
jgi:hypothetical protein